jgi:hypothetical protein
VRVDHVIYVVPDLDSGAAEFLDRFGLGSVAGGRHPGWGTGNRIVPLGESYVELVAVVDRTEAADSEFGRGVLETSARGERLAGWAVATGDLDTVARRLGHEITAGSRVRPDGSTLSWRLAAVEAALRDPWLPFFIEWQVAAGLHPGEAQADHRVRPAGIASIEVAADKGALLRWLGDGDLPLRVTGGPPRLAAVTIATADGDITLR